MVPRLLLLCALLLAAPPLAGLAAAQDDPRVRGVMSATAFRALPARAAVAVRPPDGSQHSQDIAAVFAEGLARLGHGADPGAALQLTVRVGDAPGVGVKRPPNVELRGSLGAQGNDDAELVLRMQMLDRAVQPQRTRTRLIVVELADRDGSPVWEARVEATAASDDDVALAEALAPHILAQLGRQAYDLQIPQAGG